LYWVEVSFGYLVFDGGMRNWTRESYAVY
jgi:hypothetical protein